MINVYLHFFSLAKALWSCSRCNKEWRRCLLSGFIIV